ncbi:nucleoside hydrolase [Brevibacterium spongiae]|uniref:Nucleoside hydrolase n=1 Tax=Brevibacterium spongiae TaxID=2909672 RepID=A0ABY5STH3_9MICO|nr:nucleoside hydrolase [Brevibacterium spongiae]UVI37499.1 nucleoside hydrolase [Brevibacterium spongiae]
MYSTLPLFLDCDPGIDDALALAYLCCQNDIDVVGIAASGGNVATTQVLENTRGWLALAGRSDIPVHSGHDLPLARQTPATAPDEALEYADLTHGQTGRGYARLPESPAPVSSVSAAHAWVNAAHAYPGQLVGVVIGPATNLALALDIDPELPRLFKRLFIMGGAFNYRGNTHPTTEWNVTFDPESTSRVLAAFGEAHTDGHLEHLPVIAPIEATEAVEMTPERLTRIIDGAASAGPRWQGMVTQLSEALRFYFEFHESDGLGYLAHIHDPFVLACALTWARHDATGPTDQADGEPGTHAEPAASSVPAPSSEPVRGTAGVLPWATTLWAPVDVELTGTLTRGETVADWLGRWGRPVNAEIIRTLDAPTFLDHLSTTLMKGPQA